jgi:RNA polymerase sigma-70 factor, ECF subfamily
MSDSNADDANETVRDLARSAWGRYLELIDGFRPDLFRYCRRLTGNVWDAEDLVHDALEQGFARLSYTPNSIENPRGYLLRVASNLWVTRQRREHLARASASGPRAEALLPQDAPAPDRSSELRDAGAVLLQQLAPQERAAVVLKETFDLSLEEISSALGTSVGAVKAALHRGRERLRAAEESEQTRPSRHAVSDAVIDRFVERYNARDLPGMLALMLDSAAIDMLGTEQQVGREVFGRKLSWFHYNLVNPFDGKPTQATWETAVFAGEPVVLVLNPRNGQLSVTSVMRIETDDDHVALIRVYAMCPDTVREVAAALGRPYASMGWYRFPAELSARFVAAARKANAEGGE